MPDFSLDPIKYNPTGVGNPLIGGVRQENAGDWTGYVLTGGPKGLVAWKSVAAANAGGNVFLSNHIAGSARFVPADGSGKFALGQSYKVLSGAPASEPVLLQPGVAAVPPPAGQIWQIAALFAVNGTPVPSTTTVKAGLYPVTCAGGSGAMVYTLSGTPIVETFSAGLVTGAVQSYPLPTDKRAAFAASGVAVYALGVELSAALPADCVLDVNLSLQLS